MKTLDKILGGVFIIVLMTFIANAGFVSRGEFNVTGGNATIYNGYLHIGGFDSIFTQPGDVYSIGAAYFNKSVLANAPTFGVSLMGANSGDVRNYTTLTGTGNLTVIGEVGNNTGLVCDTNKPFNQALEDYTYFLTVFNSSGGLFGTTGEITTYVNTTCSEMSLASTGLRNISNVTDLSYYIYKHPPFAALDRGVIHTHIGKHQDAKFHIQIPEGRGTYGVHIEDKAGVDQHQALTIDVDGNNTDGVVGLNIYMYSSSLVDSKLGTLMLLEQDGTGVSNSEGRFIDMRLIGMPTNTKVDGILVDPNIDHIIHVGSADTIDAAWYNDTLLLFNITHNVTSSGPVDAELFENDNSYVYIGNTGNFTTISIALETPASANLNLEYYYCNQTGGWEPLTGVTDTTSGFQVSGSITFTNPSNRGSCHHQYNTTKAVLFPDTTDYSYIALKRTRNFVVTNPVEDLFGISGATTYMIFQKDLLKLNPVETAPETCTAAFLGAIYFDISEDDMCVCKSGGWKVMTDGSPCT